MPPIVVCIVGAIGVMAAAKWIAREHRRINAELRAVRASAVEGAETDRIERLRRDAAGVYRPD